jgi:hypothetical protein
LVASCSGTCKAITAEEPACVFDRLEEIRRGIMERAEDYLVFLDPAPTDKQRNAVADHVPWYWNYFQVSTADAWEYRRRIQDGSPALAQVKARALDCIAVVFPGLMDNETKGWDELKLLQPIIDKSVLCCDAIKKWFVTTFVAVTGVALTKPQPNLLWLNFFLIFGFYSAEVVVRAAHAAFLRRTREYSAISWHAVGSSVMVSLLARVFGAFSAPKWRDSARSPWHWLDRHCPTWAPLLHWAAFPSKPSSKIFNLTNAPTAKT